MLMALPTLSKNRYFTLQHIWRLDPYVGHNHRVRRRTLQSNQLRPVRCDIHDDLDQTDGKD